VSIVKSLKLGIGDKIEVYKANMIIPQIAKNITGSGSLEIPEYCPVCGGETQVRTENDVSVLFCTNPDCQAKKIKSFALFVSRDALNIEGLSEATLEKFIQRGFIKCFDDIFTLDTHKEAIINMEGFGEKSYENLMKSVEKSKNVRLANLIYGLGILNVGLSNAKLICKAFDYDVEKIRHASAEALTEIDGIGQVIADSVVAYFSDEKNNEIFDRLLSHVDIVKEQSEGTEMIFSGMTFVITGSLNHFENRNALKTLIEDKGGKVAGSVSSKTAYLINNDSTSASSKNKKAQSLNIPIITEEEFMEKFKVS
ncbi:MAG: helix-hairpin-helix domain-containing protein, partial [Catenibacillus sp.]|nr:helix-hairpin-helix domain-containing protein [Catenibacillus sp.]